MSYGPFACQNPHPRREIRFSLIITRSVLAHQRKKPVWSIYTSCTRSPWYICLERWAIMLETITKFPSSQCTTHTSGKRFLCNGRSQVSAGRDLPLPTGLDFACPTCPVFPSDHIPKSPCVCFGASAHSKPQRSHEGSGSPGRHTALGKDLCPSAAPALMEPPRCLQAAVA